MADAESESLFLITEFLKGKKAIFYTATKVGAGRNLELFARQVLEVLAPDYLDATFSSVEAVLDLITRKVSESAERLVLVIDEHVSVSHLLHSHQSCTALRFYLPTDEIRYPVLILRDSLRI